MYDDMQDFEDNLKMAEKRAEMLRYVQEIRRMREELDKQKPTEEAPHTRENIVKEWVENLPQDTVTNSPRKLGEPRMAVPPVERGPSSETDDLSLGAEAYNCIRNAQNANQQLQQSRTSLKRRQAWQKSRSLNKESFNSDVSAHTTMSQPSSIEQLLAGRRSDPEELLSRLGFCTDSTIAGLAARIPPRFLRAQSAAQGINVHRFVSDDGEDLSRPNSPAGKREYLQFASLEDLLTYLITSGVPRRFMAPYIERYLAALLQREQEELVNLQKMGRSSPRRSPQPSLRGRGSTRVSPSPGQGPGRAFLGTTPAMVTVTPACVDVAMETEDLERMDRFTTEPGPRAFRPRRLSRQTSMSIDNDDVTAVRYDVTRLESHFPCTEVLTNGPVEVEVTRRNEAPVVYIARSNRQPLHGEAEPVILTKNHSSHEDLLDHRNDNHRPLDRRTQSESDTRDPCDPTQYVFEPHSVDKLTSSCRPPVYSAPSTCHAFTEPECRSNGTLVNVHGSVTRVTPSEGFLRVTPSYKTCSSPIHSRTVPTNSTIPPSNSSTLLPQPSSSSTSLSRGIVIPCHGSVLSSQSVTTIATVHQPHRGTRSLEPSPRVKPRPRITGENALYCHKLKMMFSPQLPNSRRESFRRAMIRSESADNVGGERRPIFMGRSFDSCRSNPPAKKARDTLSPERPKTLTFSQIKDELIKERNDSSSSTVSPIRVNSLKRLHLSPDEALV